MRPVKPIREKGRSPLNPIVWLEVIGSVFVEEFLQLSPSKSTRVARILNATGHPPGVVGLEVPPVNTFAEQSTIEAEGQSVSLVNGPTQESTVVRGNDWVINGIPPEITNATII